MATDLVYWQSLLSRLTNYPTPLKYLLKCIFCPTVFLLHAHVMWCDCERVWMLYQSSIRSMMKTVVWITRPARSKVCKSANISRQGFVAYKSWSRQTSKRRSHNWQLGNQWHTITHAVCSPPAIIAQANNAHGKTRPYSTKNGSRGVSKNEFIQYPCFINPFSFI